ncbi:MAG: phosphatase PAP2 family protein [Clostridium sp.]
MIENITSIDKEIIMFIQNNLHSDIMDWIMVVITSLGDAGLIWILMGLGLAITKKYRRVGYLVLGALLLGLILGEVILKNIIQRDRPFMIIEGIDSIIKAPTSYSFPSGHTTASFAAAGVLASSFRKKSIFIFMGASLIAISRIYLGVHFPTDIIAGIILGLTCSYLVLLIDKKISREKINKAF